jgi:hypothetical protein
MAMSQHEAEPKPLAPKGRRDPHPAPRRDHNGRPLVEEIDLNEEEEAALDAAWAHLSEKWAKERKERGQ